MLILGKIVFLVNCFASSLSLSLSGCCGAVGLTDWGGWRPSQLNCQQQFEIITEKREEILINKHTSHHITIMMAESLTFHILSLSPVLLVILSQPSLYLGSLDVDCVDNLELVDINLTVNMIDFSPPLTPVVISSPFTFRTGEFGC